MQYHELVVKNHIIEIDGYEWWGFTKIKGKEYLVTKILHGPRKGGRRWIIVRECKSGEWK